MLLTPGGQLVYGVEDDVLIVMVMTVDKSEDGVVYRSVLTRRTEKAVELVRSTKEKRLS